MGRTSKVIEVPEVVYERIVHWADRDETTGCLISRYSVGSHGYAQIGWGSVVTTCHRALWIYLNGPIPDGWTVDHTCHNRRCVEIQHYRLLTNLDNARRNQPGRDWELGVCIRGHGPEWWKPKSEQRAKGYCSMCRKEARHMKQGKF